MVPRNVSSSNHYPIPPSLRVILLKAIGICVVFLPTVHRADDRVWTDSKGRRIHARFLFQNHDQVTIIKNGKRYRFLKRRLSAADRQWLAFDARLDPDKVIVREPIGLKGSKTNISAKLASEANGDIVDIWFNRLKDQNNGKKEALRFWVQVRHPKREVKPDKKGRYPTPGRIELTVLLRNGGKQIVLTGTRLGNVHTLQWRSPKANNCHIMREFHFAGIPQGSVVEGFQVEFWDYKNKLYSRMDAPDGWLTGEIRAMAKDHTVEEIKGKNIGGRGWYGDRPLSVVTIRQAKEFPEGLYFEWNPDRPLREQ